MSSLVDSTSPLVDSTSPLVDSTSPLVDSGGAPQRRTPSPDRPCGTEPSQKDTLPESANAVWERGNPPGMVVEASSSHHGRNGGWALAVDTRPETIGTREHRSDWRVRPTFICVHLRMTVLLLRCRHRHARGGILPVRVGFAVEHEPAPEQ